VIDHEILPTVIRTVPLLLYEHISNQFLDKEKATSTGGKLLDSMPRNGAMAELCSGKFDVAY
jgi:hypothetical protein